MQLYDKLKELTPSVKFYEPDVDEFTSICVYGTPEVRKILSNLPLILKQETNQLKLAELKKAV